MTAKEVQLPLDLQVKPRFGAEDFLISGSNEAAYALIEAWPHWSSRVVMLMGPAGSGKSHLGAIWSTRARAMSLPARSLPQADPLVLSVAPAVLVEDIDGVGADRSAEVALFHFLNLAKERGASVLLTAQRPPAMLDLATADVRSRLREATLVELGAPDDALVRAVIVKLFVDRQLVVDVGVVEYLALHLERSLDAARGMIALLDREALARGRRITRQMAAELLKKIDDQAGTGHDLLSR